MFHLSSEDDESSSSSSSSLSGREDFRKEKKKKEKTTAVERGAPREEEVRVSVRARRVSLSLSLGKF